MKQNVYLVDRIGNRHERKNQYLRELYALKERKKAGEKVDAEISELKSGRDSHPYNVALKEYEEKKKEHNKLRNQGLDQPGNHMPRALHQVFSEFQRAKKDLEFYEPYTPLTYDAEMKYEEAKVKVARIPEMIDAYTAAGLEKQRLNEQYFLVPEELEREHLGDHATFMADRKKIAKGNIDDIKEKKKNHILSAKAAHAQIKREKIALEDDIKAHQLMGPKASIKDKIQALEYRQKRALEDQKIQMNSEISDVRKRIPVEVDRSSLWISRATILFPGVGQLLLGQKHKAFLWMLASLFIYFIAIPYALGFGNYQGQGVAGLITLAEGAPRVHRSLFYMIEGIIAIFLLVIAVALIIISYRDVRAVEKNEMLGMRKHNWFETKRTISQDGFPYLVNLPALILIIFIVLVPVFTTVLLSFTNMDPQHQSKFQWIGLGNYKLLATGTGIAGQAFYHILLWTIIWTILATSLAIFIGFVLALLANNPRIRGKGFFRIVYILPWAVPAFITIMFFSIMFSPQGLLTEVLSNLTGTAIQVKSSTVLTRGVLIFLQGWLGSSYIFLLATGVLQGIPGDLYEAAEIDGASPFQQTMQITIPLVLFQTAPLLIGQFTFNFNNFSIIYLFNQGGPFNPLIYGNLAGSSDLLISYIYKLTIDNQQQAIGAAITFAVSLALMFFAYLGFKNSKAFKEDRP